MYIKKTEQKLRKPTKQEIIEINNAMDKYFGTDMEGLNASDYYVSVIENYMSDCPGYAGKVITVIWGEPCFCNVLIEHNGTLQVEEINQ